MRLRVASGVLLVAATAVLAAEPRAAFLTGATYAAPDDCSKMRTASVDPARQQALPVTLTEQGYQSANTICRFTNIDERFKDRLWTVSLACQPTAGGDTTLRAEVWRKQPDGSLTVTSGKTATTLVACRSPANAPRKK